MLVYFFFKQNGKMYNYVDQCNVYLNYRYCKNLSKKHFFKQIKFQGNFLTATVHETTIYKVRPIPKDE